MAKKVLIIATNYGSWGEELQAPWDACKKAGFEVILESFYILFICRRFRG